MIKLDVQPYCQDCDLMQPIAECSKIYADNKIAVCETVIRCEMKQACIIKLEQLRNEV